MQTMTRQPPAAPGAARPPRRGPRLGLRPALAALLLAAACTAAPVGESGRYRTEQGNYVLYDPAAPATFTVLSVPGNAATDYWCAAGQFTRRVLGLAQNTRIYLLEPRRPSASPLGRSEVVFTTDPRAGTAATPPKRAFLDLSVRVSEPGFSYSEIHTRGFCRPVPPILP
jgi:hypothetical protein